MATTLSPMVNVPFADALGELRERSLSMAAVYRDWVRRLPPGPVTRLAASIADQRLGLGKALAELGAAAGGLRGLSVEFETAPSDAPGLAAGGDVPPDAIGILKRIAEAEDSDHEFLAAAAGAAVAASSEIAERLAAEAEAARKRSIWAKDQIELLGMLGPKP